MSLGGKKANYIQPHKSSPQRSLLLVLIFVMMVVSSITATVNTGDCGAEEINYVLRHKGIEREAYDYTTVHVFYIIVQ